MCIVCLTVVSLTAVAVSLTVSSCSKKPETQSLANVGDNGQLISNDLPIWVANPYSELSPGIVAGVGISKKPGSGDQLRFLIIQAESQARAEIATTLQTEVSRLVKDAMQSASIEGMNAVETSFATVTTEVVRNMPLSGAVRDKIYQDKTGIVYVRVTINSSIIKNYLEGSVSNYTEAMQKANLSRDTIKKTNASLKHLFDELNLQTNKTEIKTEEY